MTQNANLHTTVTANADQFQRTMRGVTSSASNFASVFKSGLAGISLVSLGSSLMRIADHFGDINDEASKLGMSAQEFQVLGQAAKEAGASQETLSMAISKFSVVLGKASIGNEEAKQSLQALGLSYKDFLGLNAEQKFQLIGSKLSFIKDENTKNAIAMNLFGKAFKDILPLLNKDFSKTAGELRSSGFGLSDRDVQRLDELADKADRFGKTLLNISAKGLVAVADAVEALSDSFKNLDQADMITIFDTSSASKIGGSRGKALGERVSKGIRNGPTDILDVLSSSTLKVARNSNLLSLASNVSVKAMEKFTGAIVSSYGEINSITQALKGLGKEQAGRIIGEAIKPRDAMGNVLPDIPPQVEMQIASLLADALANPRVAAYRSQDIGNIISENSGFDTTGIVEVQRQLDNLIKSNKSENAPPIKLDITVTASEEFNVLVKDAVTGNITDLISSIATAAVGSARR